MKYAKEILEILYEAGYDGLKINKISRHVFNNHNNFFETISMDKVHTSVSNFLRKEVSRKDSIVEKASKSGYYRIKSTILPSKFQLYIENL